VEKVIRSPSRQAVHSRHKTLATADIGELPKIRRKSLRESCKLDLHRFLTKCFPESTGLKPFSEDQVAAVKNLEEAILRGGRLAQALPRGFAKTAIAVRAAIWAVVYGHRSFVAVYCANATAAEKIVESMKQELENNPILFDLFPEVCHPIRSLGGKPQAVHSQTYLGELTKIKWKAAQVVMPTIPDSVCSGSVLEAKAVNASRGAQHTTATGKVLRPDFIILDDPQTDEDAENPQTVAKIVRKIKRSVLRGGGHSKSVAAVANVTVIEQDDVAENFLNDPAWMAVRFKMLKSMPTRLEDLWLGQYREIRHGFEKNNPESKRKALEESLRFYKKHRKEMDAGAEASWSWCYAWDDPSACEISAIQHAMNILIDDGPDVFFHECQNDTKEGQADTEKLGWRDIATRVRPYPRGVAPNDSVCITGQIDVHDDVLSWGLVAWTQRFGGQVIAYGTYPEQPRRHFLFRKVTKTMRDVAPKGSDLDGVIYHAISELVTTIADGSWKTDDGSILRVAKILVDSGYKPKPVKRVCREHRYAPILVPAKGRGVRAKDRPISEWRTPPGGIKGEEWMYTRPDKGSLRLLTFDANYWKSFSYESIAMPIGNEHAVALYDAPLDHHKMIGEHWTSEYYKRVEYAGRKVDEWELPSSRPDNHLWDFLVGSAVGASMCGIKREAYQPPTSSRTKRRRRVSYL
jgi:hypothetical protein